MKDTFKNIVIGTLVLTTILFSSLYFLKPTAIKVVEGASSGPDHYNTEVFYAGIAGLRVQFVSTTTVACMVQNSTNATSSWSAGFKTVFSTTTTTVLGLATSTNANRFSTTTALQTITIPANNLSAANYSPASGNGIIGPKDWVIWGYMPGTTLGNVPQAQVGNCEALFRAI